MQRLDRRLLLLQLLVEFDEHGHTDLMTDGERLSELLLCGVLLDSELLRLGMPALGGWQTPLALLQLLGGAASASGVLRLPAWVPHSAAGRRRLLRRYEDARHRLQQRLQPYQRKKSPSQKDRDTMKRMKVSLTDPEAALGRDKVGTYRPLYNVLLVQATDAPLTLAWDVLARNNDDGLLKPMMEKTQEQLGRPLPEVLVDGAFVSIGEVAWCEGEGITVYAPPAQARAAASPQSVPTAEEQAATAGVPQKAAGSGGGAGQKKLPKEAFRYDSVEKVYYCPEGKRLKAVSRTTLQRGNGIELPMIVHQARVEDCQGCPRRQECTSSARTGRTVKRYEGEEALERLQQRMAEPANQEIYKLRSRSVELGYADIKEHRGLRTFRCFGRKRARAQAGLVILTSNGLKIMNALQRRTKIEPHPAPSAKQPA